MCLLSMKGGVHFRRGERLLEKINTEYPMSSLWGYIESLRCCPVMQSLFPVFISAIICLEPWVP